MSYSFYIGIACFVLFGVVILLWSICQYKNQKSIEEMFTTEHSLHGEQRNGLFYISSLHNIGREGGYDYNFRPSLYETPTSERRNEYPSSNMNSASRANSPPAYETFYEIDVEIPPSYEECIKLGYK